jgi:DNA-binding NarL/FixJ family response regulator
MPDRPTCIVADDHALIREVLRLRLEDLELVEIVGEASNWVEAVDLVQAARPTIALLDLRMPGGNGLQMIEQLRAGDTRSKLIVFSACRESGMVTQARVAGADAFIAKDVPGSVFAGLLRSVIDGSPFLSAIDDDGLACEGAVAS